MNENKADVLDIKTGEAYDPDVETTPVTPQQNAQEQTPMEDEEAPARLPEALMRQFVKQLAGAAMAAVISTVFLVKFHTPQCCLGFAVTAYLVYTAVMLQRDYARGKICEVAAVCSSVTNMSAQNATRVVFRSVMESELDAPVYYEFYVPGRQRTNTAFIPNYIYVIYFRERDPKKLLGYFQT